MAESYLALVNHLLFLPSQQVLDLKTLVDKKDIPLIPLVQRAVKGDKGDSGEPGPRGPSGADVSMTKGIFKACGEKDLMRTAVISYKSKPVSFGQGVYLFISLHSLLYTRVPAGFREREEQKGIKESEDSQEQLVLQAEPLESQGQRDPRGPPESQANRENREFLGELVN